MKETLEAEIVEEKSLARAPSAAPAVAEERSVEEVLAQMEKVQQLMRSALTKDEHYGVIPGTKKPSLLQPGAQKLCFMFRLIPSFRIEACDELANNHREYRIRCRLTHAATGQLVGEGVGSCSTMEAKYRWRSSERSCPVCGGEFIKRSKFEKDGDKGWYCYGKIGGCGENFVSTDPRIVEQETGRKENPDIADTYNTVLKMAKKRAFVDATLTATAASDIFTQDTEDMPGLGGADEPPPPEPPRTGAKTKSAPKPKQNGKGKITPAQQSDLWARAMTRAEDVGATREQIMKDVVMSLELTGTDQIPAADYDRVTGMIDSWEPGIEYGDDGSEGDDENESNRFQDTDSIR